ncbi:MAG: hypothetical protein KatS3mg105_2839 [Gemmatales bacterium]|nr:MAG: hypothetical protein KatS3mg105_2839 [Gemmatales bacterium]
MITAVLGKIFGREQRWSGPCTIVLDGEASIQALGTDSIIGGGAKQYAPRMVSGRILADAACLLQDGSALIALQQVRQRTPTGEETVKTFCTICDPNHVIAVEFDDTSILSSFGLAPPPIRPGGSHHGKVRTVV